MDKKHHLFNAYRSVKTALTMQSDNAALAVYAVQVGSAKVRTVILGLYLRLEQLTFLLVAFECVDKFQ